MAAPYYIMPNGTFPMQGGSPVLIDQSAFEACCCDGDPPNEIFVKICQVPGIDPWGRIDTHSSGSGTPSWSSPLDGSFPDAEQPNQFVVRLFYIPSDNGSSLHDIILAKAGGLSFPLYFAYEYVRNDGTTFLWYLAKESNTGQWMVRIVVLTASDGTDCDGLDYNNAVAAFDFVYPAATGSLPTQYSAYTHSVRYGPTRTLPCIGYSSTAAVGSACNPTGIQTDHSGMYAVVGANAITLMYYDCLPIPQPEISISITPSVLTDPALYPTYHAFDIQIDNIPCTDPPGWGEPPEVWTLRWDWNDPSIPSSFSEGYTDSVASTGISKTVSWAWEDLPPDFPLLPSYELVVTLEDKSGTVVVSGSAWIFFSTVQPELDCSTWKPSEDGGFEGSSDLWPLTVDGSPMPVGSEIDLKFETFSIPDKIDIIYDGKTYSINWVGGDDPSSYPSLTPYNQIPGGEGYWNAVFTKKEGVDSVVVITYGSTSGTAWNYSLRAACAVDGVPDRTGFDTPPGVNINDGSYTIEK